MSMDGKAMSGVFGVCAWGRGAQHCLLAVYAVA